MVENGTTTAGRYYGGSNTISAPAEAVYQADVASGKLANLLASVNNTWGQDLEQENAYPVLNGKAVYFSGSKLCNGHLLSEAYTNDETQKTVTPAHSQEYVDGGFAQCATKVAFCTAQALSMILSLFQAWRSWNICATSQIWEVERLQHTPNWLMT